ncbi:MAG: GtrA family protein [Oscillospiraceae bacterium]|jgi:putative flippase GtrA|nr:GtrA family protein [Oscillospiraceae bacterium]
MIQKYAKAIIRRFPEETLRYIVAGAATTAVNFLVFTLLAKAAGVDDNAANVVAVSLAILFAYAANKLYVFRKRADSARGLALEFLSFAGSRLATMALEIFGYMLLVRALHEELAAKLITQIAVFAANYILGKVFVFKKQG